MHQTSIIGAETWGNVPSDMCAQWRLKSAWASTQSDQSIHSLHEETLHPWLSEMCQANAQADLNLRWAQMLEGSFSDVVVHCIFLGKNVYNLLYLKQCMYTKTLHQAMTWNSKLSEPSQAKRCLRSYTSSKSPDQRAQSHSLIRVFGFAVCSYSIQYLSFNVRKRSFGHVRPAKIQISLHIRAAWSESSLSAFWTATDAKCLHACEFTRSDQHLRWAHFEHPRLQSFFVQTRKALIRLCRCQVFFGALVKIYVFSCSGSSVESVSRWGSPFSDWEDAEADLSNSCPHMADNKFSHDAAPPHIVAPSVMM